MENGYKWILDEALLYFPFLERDTIEWHPYRDDGYAIVFSYKDGHKTFYDSLFKTVRSFRPEDGKEIDEEIWRMEVGKNIRRAMVKYGVTQMELSIRTDISQASLSKYINGDVTPSGYKLWLIAEALDCDIDELTFVRRLDNI